MWIQSLRNNVLKLLTSEIEEKALEMGMKLPQDASLLHLAKECLTAPLPKFWRPVVNSRGQSYYVDLVKGEAYCDHPVDMHYQRAYEKAKKIKRGRPFQRFSLEEVSSRLPAMVQQKRKEMNILIELNPISELQTERNEEGSEKQRSNPTVGEQPAFSDRAFIYEASDTESADGKEQLKEMDEATAREKRLAIQKEEEQRIEARLASELNKYREQLDAEIEEGLNRRRLQLISDINCHRMEKQQEIEGQSQRIHKQTEDSEHNYQRKIRQAKKLFDKECEYEIKTILEQRLGRLESEVQVNLLEATIKLSAQITRKQTYPQLKCKLQHIYNRQAEVEGQRLRKQLRLDFTSRLASQLRMRSKSYHAMDRTAELINKQNIHENCLENFKQQLQKSEALDMQDNLTRQYFHKQRGLTLVRPGKKVQTELKQQWESLERVRQLIANQKYTEAKQFEKTLRNEGIGFNAENLSKPVWNGHFLLGSSLPPKLQYPPLNLHEHHKPRLAPRLYRKII